MRVVEEARDRFLARLRREFMRFLVSVKGIGRIEATFTTGAGSLMAGTDEMLGEVFGVEPRPLSFFCSTNSTRTKPRTWSRASRSRSAWRSAT